MSYKQGVLAKYEQIGGMALTWALITVGLIAIAIALFSHNNFVKATALAWLTIP